MSHYDELGVASDATAAEVRRAYVALARRHHPDAGGDPARMRALNAAFAVLADPERRRRYDVESGTGSGSSPPAAGSGAGRAWAAGSWGTTVDGDDLSGADPADLLDDTPFGPPVERPPITLLPPGLFFLGLLSAALFVVFGHPALLAGAGTLLFFAVIATAAVALLTLTRSARTSRPR